MTKALLTITAHDQSKTYGDELTFIGTEFEQTVYKAPTQWRA